MTEYIDRRPDTSVCRTALEEFRVDRLRAVGVPLSVDVYLSVSQVGDRIFGVVERLHQGME